MSVDSPEELEALRAAGQVVAQTIRAMGRAVRPGITTAEHTILIRERGPVVLTA